MPSQGLRSPIGALTVAICQAVPIKIPTTTQAFEDRASFTTTGTHWAHGARAPVVTHQGQGVTAAAGSTGKVRKAAARPKTGQLLDLGIFRAAALIADTANEVSLLFAAFSSSRMVDKSVWASSCPKTFAHSLSVP